MKTAFLSLLLAGSLPGSASQACAQAVPSLGSSAQQAANMASANITKLRLANRPATPLSATAPAKGPALPAGPGARPAAARSYGYVPTEALRQETVRRAVANAQDTNPAGARVIADYFGTTQHAYQPYYDQARRRTALPDNDAVAAMAVYLLAGYLIINNYRTDPTTPAQAQGVRAQVTALAATNPRFARGPGPNRRGYEAANGAAHHWLAAEHSGWHQRSLPPPHRRLLHRPLQPRLRAHTANQSRFRGQVRLA